jgi:hypothetical protein
LARHKLDLLTIGKEITESTSILKNPFLESELKRYRDSLCYEDFISYWAIFEKKKLKEVSEITKESVNKSFKRRKNIYENIAVLFMSIN